MVCMACLKSWMIISQVRLHGAGPEISSLRMQSWQTSLHFLFFGLLNIVKNTEIVKPLAPRHYSEDIGNRLFISIPSRKNLFIIIFIGIWLAGWAFGEIMVGG